MQRDVMDERELDEQDFLDKMRYRDLVDSKVDVRSTCSRCEGRGIKNGETCEVCNGERVVTQAMSLYALGKKLLPFFIHSIKREMAAAEEKGIA